LNNLTLLTENSLKQFKAHFSRLHDSFLKSLSYEYDHNGQEFTKSIHIRISAKIVDKQWQDRWENWVTLYLLIENVSYVNIVKGQNAWFAEKVLSGELGLMAGSAFIALDSDYPQVELYNFETSPRFNFLIIGKPCYWSILPYEPLSSYVPEDVSG
jgi:hypothetical protein